MSEALYQTELYRQAGTRRRVNPDAPVVFYKTNMLCPAECYFVTIKHSLQLPIALGSLVTPCVPHTRLELACLSTPEPKSGVYTNSTNGACLGAL